MNHKVQLCARGCLTLKLSLSSNTVTGLQSVAAAASAEEEGLFPPSGEMGIVDKSTCSDILGLLDEEGTVRSGVGLVGVVWTEDEVDVELKS